MTLTNSPDRIDTDSAQTCTACGRALPLSRFIPRAFAPDGTVLRYHSHCRDCRSARQAWDRERKRRTSYLDRHGFGPGAFGGNPETSEDQQLLPAPPGPAMRPLPVMPNAYFAQRGKRGPYRRRQLTPEEEAAKMKADEKLQKTKAYQKALQASLRRTGLLRSIEHAEQYLAYVEDHYAKWGCMHHYLPPRQGSLEPRRMPWRVCTEPLGVLRQRTAERLAELRGKLEVTPEVALPSLD